jgi:hypothetical protein
MGWMIGVLGFDSRRGPGIFLFTTASRTALGPTQPPIQWVPGALSLGVKQLGREAGSSPPSSVEGKEWVELYHPSHNTSSWRDAQLKAQGQLCFYIYTNWQFSVAGNGIVYNMTTQSKWSILRYYPLTRSVGHVTKIMRTGEMLLWLIFETSISRTGPRSITTFL